MGKDTAIISTDIITAPAGDLNFTVIPVEGTPGILLSTLWNQSGIIDIGDNTTVAYNEYCPTDTNTSTHSVTGCTNTAAGQIIYYYIERKGLELALTLENPDEYTSIKGNLTIDVKADGSTPGTLSFAAINSYLADYDLDSAEDAAALLYACGVVQQADYSSSGTSTAWEETLFYRSGMTGVTVSRLYWGDSCWGTEIEPGLYSFTDEGFEVLIENLEAGQPVGASIPGHAVVIDGYDSGEDRFHINFGWGKYSPDTRWYTRQEIRDLNFYEFIYDLRTDHQETFTVTDSRLYGTGTMIRAFEQANGMSGDNTVRFDSAVRDQALELTEYIRLSGNTAVSNFNMLLTVTDSSSSWGFGFRTSDSYSAVFDDFSGALIVDTENNYNFAFYLSDGSDSAVYADNALIYAGSYAVGNDYSLGAAAVLTSLQSARENDTDPGQEVLDSAYFSFYGSAGKDIYSLTNRSIAVGDVFFGDGDDELILTGHSRLYGTVSPGNGDDAITIDSTSSLIGGLYNYTDLTFELHEVSESAMFTITDSVYNIYYYAEISADMSDAELGTYTLFEAAGGASYPTWLSQLSITVTGTGESDIVLSGSGTTVSEYADLIVEDNALKLQIKKQAPVPAAKTAGDLNGDGRADIVMTIDQSTHPADGATGAWLIQENQTPVWGNLSQRNAGWEIFGMGWTAAGKSANDVYVRNSDNVIGAWTTDNDGVVNGWETIGSFDPDAQIVGLGDFNGNGQTDLLLRAANGAVGCYFTNGQGWNYFQSLGDEWKLSAIGDLNGDGRADVVLAHDAGFAGCWLTQADGTPMWAGLDTLANGFEIIGAGDFNGDGTDDVLLKNGSYYGAWLVQNGNAVGWLGIGDLGDAAVEQIADFNADGVDDLRIRTAGGDLGALLVMGEDSLDWHYYGSVGNEWNTSLAALS